MKKVSFLPILGILSLLVSCSPTRDIPGYDNTEDKFNTNLFYRNDGQVQAADPHVICDDGMFYMYATNANGNGDCSYLQVFTSYNLTDWTNNGICYQPKLTNWAIDGLWAPEVIKFEEKYYLYYSGWDIKHGGHQIGVAVSDSPLGPFIDYVGESANGYIDSKNAPIKFDFSVIDASPFIDKDGEKYLLFTKDQYQGVSSIYIAKLNDDMVTIDYSTITLLSEPVLDWEMQNTNHWNEAPFLYEHEGVYYLFYSANYYMDRYYGIGVSTSSSPMGPFEKAEEPVLITQDYWDYISGTGHCSLFTSPDGKEVFMAYHSHIDTILGGGERKINFDRVNFVEGKVLVNGPSISPQLLPSGVGEYQDITSKATIKVNGSLNNGLKDNLINNLETKLEHEVDVLSNKAIITVDFEEEQILRAIMIYDSANFDYCLPKVDDIEINGKHIKDIMMNESYYGNDDYLFKIPCSAFIYEFDELKSNKITITLSSSENIYLNEIKVVGK